MTFVLLLSYRRKHRYKHDHRHISIVRPHAIFHVAMIASARVLSCMCCALLPLSIHISSSMAPHLTSAELRQFRQCMSEGTETIAMWKLHRCERRSRRVKPMCLMALRKVPHGVRVGYGYQHGVCAIAVIILGLLLRSGAFLLAPLLVC